MKKIYTILLFTTALLVTACNTKVNNVAADTTSSVKVKVAQATLLNANSNLAVSGKIKAVNSADVSTRIMGFVNKVYVKVGDKVTKGQILVAINNADLQAKKEQVHSAIVSAETTLKNVRKNYNRYKNLFDTQSISQKEMDDMKTNYLMAKAQLDLVKAQQREINAQFAYTNITAPFNGVITSKNIEVGAMANPGVSLLSIENSANFEVIAMVPESEIANIKNEMAVNVLVKSISKEVPGRVVEVSSSAKNSGTQYLVKVKLEKSNKALLSGMFATVQFPINKKSAEQTVVIDKKALVTKGQLTGVYTVGNNKKALLRWLRLGKDYNNTIEVLSGIQANETYIISANEKLYNGVKISIQ
ncbi:efflux RND transporter periplasmic adaptor subunit [Polaribacter tangerinus]|uniref:efflux RND transporter periplasmic adaptor subunit n=1 Tax=Polaribacter tangerinus TaxID=1920034 RepID=UPI000B4AEC85|nr:efflux RND transporter periplasmic adaptor subunit [Polaribacter tangerinus]